MPVQNVAKSCCKMQAFEALIYPFWNSSTEFVSKQQTTVATSDLYSVDNVFLLLKVKCKGTHARVNPELLGGTTTGGETATPAVEVRKSSRVIAPNDRVLQYKAFMFRVWEV